MGIKSGSAAHQYGDEYVIFSVNNKDMSYEVMTGIEEELIFALKFIPHKRLVGYWKGEREISYLIPWSLYQAVEPIVRKAKQECILKLDSPTGGSRYLPESLIWYDGRTEFIGWMRCATKEEAEGEDSYTYDPEFDAYFVVGPYSDSIEKRNAQAVSCC